MSFILIPPHPQIPKTACSQEFRVDLESKRKRSENDHPVWDALSRGDLLATVN